jgi:Carbohydrate binding domain (family 11)
MPGIERGVVVPSIRVKRYAALAALVSCIGVGPAAAALVDGFEGGLPTGTGGGSLVGFGTFSELSLVTIGTTDMPPAPVPGAAAGNTVLRLDVSTVIHAGVVHVFENSGVDGRAPQDWSSFGALTLWLYGNDSGTDLYIDVLDDASGDFYYPYEIWTSTFRDDFRGWKQLSFAFADLMRRDIGNGAVNNGLGLTSVHGWALGSLTTAAPQTYFVDDVRLTVPTPGTLALLSVCLVMMVGAGARRPR